MDWFLYDNGLRHERVKQMGAVYYCYFITLSVTENMYLKKFLKTIQNY